MKTTKKGLKVCLWIINITIIAFVATIILSVLFILNLNYEFIDFSSLVNELSLLTLPYATGSVTFEATSTLYEVLVMDLVFRQLVDVLLFMPILLFFRKKLQAIINDKYIFEKSDEKFLIRSCIYSVLITVVLPNIMSQSSNFVTINDAGNIKYSDYFYSLTRFDFGGVLLLIAVYVVVIYIIKYGYLLRKDKESII